MPAKHKKSKITLNYFLILHISFSFEVLGPGGETGDDTISVVEAPDNNPNINLPSISDLPQPDLGPDFTPANSVPPNTVPGSDTRE